MFGPLTAGPNQDFLVAPPGEGGFNEFLISLGPLAKHALVFLW